MGMSALVIGEFEKEKLKKLKETAEAKPLTPTDLMSGKAIGDNPNYSVFLPVGFRVVYSLEEQKFGICRHMSVSLMDGERIPNEFSIDMIAEELGFRNKPSEAIRKMMEKKGHPLALLRGAGYAYAEEQKVSGQYSINVLEAVDIPLKPGELPFVPPFIVHGDSSQYGASECSCGNCGKVIGECANPMEETPAKYFPTHTHGLSDIGWPEIFINAAAFGAKDNTYAINQIFAFLWLNPEVFKEFKEKGELEIDPDAIMADEDRTPFVVRMVEPSFTAVVAAYNEEDIKDTEHGFAQLYVKGDDHVLRDDYYTDGGHA